MGLDVVVALREGVWRATGRNGLLLMGVLFLIGAVNAALSQTVLAGVVDVLVDLERADTTSISTAEAIGATPFALPIPPVAAGVGLLGGWVLGQAVTVVAIRTFVSDTTEHIPQEYRRRRLGWVVVNALVGEVVVGVLVAVGLLLLVVPGIFLAISFYVTQQVIAVEDVNFVDAMYESWGLAAGNRIEVLVLAIVLVGLSIGLSLPGAVIGEVNPVLGATYDLAVSVPVTVFSIAAVSRAYVQLVETREITDEVGALGPEDLEGPGV